MIQEEIQGVNEIKKKQAEEKGMIICYGFNQYSNPIFFFAALEEEKKKAESLEVTLSVVSKVTADVKPIPPSNVGKGKETLSSSLAAGDSQNHYSRVESKI